jgi:hypothetical protein
VSPKLTCYIFRIRIPKAAENVKDFSVFSRALNFLEKIQIFFMDFSWAGEPYRMHKNSLD